MTCISTYEWVTKFTHMNESRTLHIHLSHDLYIYEWVTTYGTYEWVTTYRQSGNDRSLLQNIVSFIWFLNESRTSSLLYGSWMSHDLSTVIYPRSPHLVCVCACVCTCVCVSLARVPSFVRARSRARHMQSSWLIHMCAFRDSFIGRDTSHMSRSRAL